MNPMLERLVTRRIRLGAMSYARVRGSSELWRPALLRRELSDCEKTTVRSQDCRTTRDAEMDDDPCPPQQDETLRLCPELPPCHPDADPRKLAFWRAMSLYVALPVVVVVSVITYLRLREKAKEPRQPFLDLPYMCRRTKPFPWGDGNHTLFHNPVKNPVPPHGYEVDDPNEVSDEKASN